MSFLPRHVIRAQAGIPKLTEVEIPCFFKVSIVNIYNDYHFELTKKRLELYTKLRSKPIW